jgi:1-acyl-sn-glycerol-3-phosphate acyltransferase
MYIFSKIYSITRLILLTILTSTITPIVTLPLYIIGKIFNLNIRMKPIFECVTQQVLDVKHKYLKKSEPLISRGIILPNHRTWCDGFIDFSHTQSIGVWRGLAALANNVTGFFVWLDNQMIIIPGKKNRQYVFNKIIKYMNNGTDRITIYPEGARLLYTEVPSIDFVKSKLKPGFLKSVYEYQTIPVQVMISKNKENVVNEFIYKINYGVTIYTSLSKPIYPKDYPTFDDFFTAIATEWYNQWQYVFSTPEDI